MGNSSSSDKLTDAETTAQKHLNSKDFASLMYLLKQESVDLFKVVSFNEDNPEDIKNGYDFIHTLLSADHLAFGPSSLSAVSILKAFKQTIESNKQKNTTDKKLFRETPQFDKFPHSYLQFVIFNNPQDVESFIFLLDNKETFPSPPPASQSLVHDLCSTPRAIELLRHLISSGEFPERFKNSSSTNDLDEQMRGSANCVVLEHHRSYTPLQAACAAANKLAVQELCVAGLGGSNYGECAETLLTSAIAGEQHHKLGSMVLFKKENGPQEVSADDVSDILLCLLAQPNADSSIRKHRVQLSSIQSQKARNAVAAVFESQFNISSLNTLNLMHLAFAVYDELNKNAKNNSSADTFLKTALDNKLAVCAPEELTLTSGILISASMRRRELESALKLIDKYRLREWLITSEQELDLSSCGKTVVDYTLQRVSSALPSLQSLNLKYCKLITDNGLQHLVSISSFRSLNLYNCDKISDSGLQHLAKLSSLQSLDLSNCQNITDSGIQHLAKLSSLQSLKLMRCYSITDSGLQHLAKLPLLQALNLGVCDKFTDSGLRHIAKLSSLQSLDLESCGDNITDSGLEILANVSFLQTLSLVKCDKITDRGLQHLAKLSSLVSVNFSWCTSITDSGLQHLATLSSLQTLKLEHCDNITDSGLQHLATLSSLQSLNLGYCNKITDGGLENIAKLLSLQSLDLTWCKLITDSGLRHIAKLSSLQSLDLYWCNNITDNGLQHLARLSSLQSLNLSHCDKITDGGLEHLAQLSSLQTLMLYSCDKITDIGLHYLANLSSIRS